MNNNSTSILEFASSIALPNQKTFVTPQSYTANNHYHSTQTRQLYSIIAGDVNRIIASSGISGISGTQMPAVSGLVGLPAYPRSGFPGPVGQSGISGFNPVDTFFSGSNTEKILNDKLAEEFERKYNLIYGGETNTITASGLDKFEKTQLKTYKKSLEDLGFITFEPFEFQKKLLQNLEINNKLVIRSQRQMGISTCLAIYALHHALNNPASKIKFIVNDSKSMRRIVNLIELLDKSLSFETSFRVTVENNYYRLLQFNNYSSIEIESPTNLQSVYGDVFRPEVYENCNVLISDNGFDLFNMKSFHAFNNAKQKVIISSNKETYREKYKSEDYIYSFGEMFWEVTNNITIFKPINIRWEMHPDRTDEWAKGQIEKMGVREFVKQFGTYHPPIRVHHIETGTVHKEDVPNLITGEMNSVKRVPILNPDHLSIKDYPVLKYESASDFDQWDIDKSRKNKKQYVSNRDRLTLRETHTASQKETDGYISSASKDRKICEIVLGDKPIISNMHIEDRDVVIEILKICNSYIELKSKNK